MNSKIIAGCRWFNLRLLLLAGCWFAASPGTAAEGMKWLMEEQLTFGAGIEAPLLLKKQEIAGQYFSAAAGFDTIAIEMKFESGWQGRAHFVLYGPFAEQERPANYQGRRVYEQTINLSRGPDPEWYHFRFVPQPAGHYYWTIRNVSERMRLALYTRNSGLAGNGYAVVREQPVYWQDLKSAYSSAYIAEKPPLPLPAVDTHGASARGRKGKTGTRGGRFWARAIPDQVTSGLLQQELPLLAQIGIRGLSLQLQSSAQFALLPALAQAATDSRLQGRLSVRNWDSAGVSRFLEISAEAKFRAQPERPGAFGNLFDVGYRARTLEAWRDICAAAKTASGLDALEISGGLNFPAAPTEAALEALTDALSRFFNDQTPLHDDNGDGETFESVFAQAAPDWPAAAGWLARNQAADPRAQTICRYVNYAALDGWLEQLNVERDALPLRLESADLNLLSAAAARLGGVTLLDPDARQLDVLTRLYSPRPLQFAADQLFLNAGGPDRLEKIRWLICRQLDQPLDWFLGDWNLTALNQTAPLRRDDFQLVERWHSLPACGLKRDLRAARELSPFTRPRGEHRARILVVAGELTRAPFVADARYIHESALPRLTPRELKAFRLMLLCAPGPGATTGAMTALLERFVKSGGTVLLAPEQFALNGRLPPILPRAHRAQLARRPAPDASGGRLLYHDPYDDDQRWRNDADQYANYVGSTFKVQNGMLGVAPFGGKADLFYKFKLPPTARYLEVRLSYRAWGGQDWIAVNWGAEQEKLNSAEARIERGKTLEWRRVFDVRAELPYETFYLHALLFAYDPARAADDVQGAAVEDLHLIVYDDPLAFSREIEFAGASLKTGGIPAHYLAADERLFEPLGRVITRGGTEYPLAYVARASRRGKWIYCNAPECFGNEHPAAADLLDRLLQHEWKGYSPPQRKTRVIRGQNFLAVSKPDELESVNELQLTFPAHKSGVVVFDVFQRTLVEHRQSDGRIVFETDLQGPQAAKLFLIKPADRPRLIVADGERYNLLQIEDGVYQNRVLEFFCAQRAWVFSARPPQLAVSDSGERDYTYDPRSGLLVLEGTGRLERCRIQF